MICLRRIPLFHFLSAYFIILWNLWNFIFRNSFLCKYYFSFSSRFLIFLMNEKGISFCKFILSFLPFGAIEGILFRRILKTNDKVGLLAFSSLQNKWICILGLKWFENKTTVTVNFCQCFTSACMSTRADA